MKRTTCLSVVDRFGADRFMLWDLFFQVKEFDKGLCVDFFEFLEVVFNL
jgi:hypothetical protein